MATPMDNVRPIRPNGNTRPHKASAEPPILPYNVEAEQATLGAILIDPDMLTVVFDVVGLAPTDFYRDAHQQIAAAMLDLRRRETPVDVLTLPDALEVANHLEAVGGAPYVNSLANNVPSSLNTEHYARIVKRDALRRRTIALGERMYQQGFVVPDVAPEVEVWREQLNALAEAAQPTTASRFGLIPDDEVERMQPPEMLIGGWFIKDTLALIYGDMRTGKSFLAVDLAEHVATGRAWQGHPVKQGPVVYIAAEGAAGFSKRIRAWKAHHQVSGFTGLYLISQAVQLLEPAQVQEAIREIGRLEQAPVLVVVDTLGRSMAGGDENANSDIHQVIHAADAIRHAFGCTVLLIHHDGKDEARGPRGGSALRDDVDTVYALTRNEDMTRVHCWKQKDIEEPADFHFSLRSFALDDYGDETSCVIDPADVRPTQPSGDLLPSEHTTLTALHGYPDGSKLTEWRERATAAGISDKSFWRAKKKLEQSLLVGSRYNLWFLTPEGEEALS